VTIDFDEAAHVYTLNGEVVPSVTQVLGDVLPGWQAGEWYLQRGQAVHAAAAMIAWGVEFDHDPQIEGQVRACRRFFREVQPRVIQVEFRVASEVHGYAGTLDLLATINGKPTVLDWKASIAPSARYQVAAYALAYGESQVAPCPRYGCAVALGEDGYYKMSKMWDLRQLRAGWLALLAAHRIRREAGIKEAQA